MFRGLDLLKVPSESYFICQKKKVVLLVVSVYVDDLLVAGSNEIFMAAEFKR